MRNIFRSRYSFCQMCIYFDFTIFFIYLSFHLLQFSTQLSFKFTSVWNVLQTFIISDIFLEMKLEKKLMNFQKFYEMCGGNSRDFRKHTIISGVVVIFRMTSLLQL